MSKSAVERWLEAGLFASRWLLAPFYLGLVVALVGLLIVFGRELYGEVSHILTMRPQDGILMALSLIDLSLAGNLVIIVILSGYENFVAKIATPERSDRPDWLGGVDFSGLKMKVMASIVAISAIALLRAFMDLAEPDTTLDRSKLVWLVAIHLTFVVSAVLLAAMDWLISQGKTHQGGAS
ncbi:MAG: TIGR00645 family protein [Pseudomonadota bacterium]|nr:TIGR00645 family protein [Pseudomonadota bacterium]